MSTYEFHVIIHYPDNARTSTPGVKRVLQEAISLGKLACPSVMYGAADKKIKPTRVIVQEFID